MASAVTVIFGANSTQFQAELARMQTMTTLAARRMSTGVASGHTVGMTGMIRESTVIGREIMMGRGIGRILGSLTLLIQYISSASRAAQQGASAAKILADGYAEAALKANVAATAAMKKAEASAAAAEAEGFEVDATLAAADADAIEASSAKATAAALGQKAAAAEADAVAQSALAESSAAGGVSMLGLVAIFGTVALAAAAVYEAVWGVKNIIQELSFTGAKELKDDYIPMMKRHLNDAKNAQKEVTDEVNKTVSAYNSASEAAKRQADSTKEHFEHLKKMLELQKQTELIGAKTIQQKEATEAKFSGQELQLALDQQKAELADKITEKTNLETDAKNKLAKANAIVVNTREEDQKMLGDLNQNAEAAQKFLETSSTLQEFKVNAAEDLTAGKNDAEIDAARMQGINDAQHSIAIRNKFANKVESNDELRKTKGSLTKEAAKSAAEAVKIGLAIPDIAKQNAQGNAAAAAEAAAKLAEEKARDNNGEASKGYSLNSQQRIGAYAATSPVLLQQLTVLHSIDRKVTPAAPASNNPPGQKMPQLGPKPQSFPIRNVPDNRP